MYEAFYGLRERPFDLTPNPRFLFVTPRQREALANLRYGLTTPRGLTLLLGEAGTGKTTLVHAILAELASTSHQTVLISNPTLTRDEFYEFLVLGLELGTGATHSKARLLFELRRELLERVKAGRFTSVIVDEAQSVPYELLEEIRLLGNIETTTTKLLNVVLAGQPELADRLNEPSLRQLKQRVSLRCQLGSFDLQSTASYIAGRLRIAGGNAAAIFTKGAAIAIYEMSGGLPRTINVIADNALIGGFAEQVRPVTADIVRHVGVDFDLSGSETAAPEASVAAVAAEPVVARDPVVARAPVAARVPAAAPGSTAARTDGAAPPFNLLARKRRFVFF